ncbi:MAG: 2-oxoglutarate dehydrogenase complex dihydrolipoyllysine-residue succinyltransferase [Planctomycetaceae bacterium]
MTIDVKVPAVGESVTEVYIGEWRKSEGDNVRQDEELVELESDKATFDAPAPATGVLVEILKKAGDRAGVGEVIARIDPSGDGGQAGESKKSVAAEPKRKQPEKEKADEKERRGEQPTAEKRQKEDAQPRDEVESETESEARIMPAARRALDDYNLDAEGIEPTGPGGRLLKEDVLRHVQQESKKEPRDEAKADGGKPAAREGTREEKAVPLSPIRRTIGRRLVEAQKNAALLTTFNEADMSAVMSLRSKYRDAFQKKHNIKLGIMSFFVKAAVEALQTIPEVNAEIRDDQIIYHNYCDVGIAIGVEKGLVVPVLKNAEAMSFADVELAIDDFARRAQSNRLKIDELRGGTFTISNGGIYGSLLSTPIVNPPQSGVLGMHAIQERPVVRDGQIVARPMMYLALSYDHRLVDGREAVTFLRRIKECIEDPARLLIEV